MTSEESTELTEPCVGTLYDPTPLIAPELAPVLVPSELAVLAIRDDEFDASLLEPLAQRIGVVGPVGDHALRLLSRAALGAV